jgi:cytochrome c-type biogenesis protein CcmH
MNSRNRRGVVPLIVSLLVGLPATGFPVDGGPSPGPASLQEASEQVGSDTAAVARERAELTDPREAELDALTAEVAAQLRCPVCRNQSVLESNAKLAREMQQMIRERLAAGETPDEVKAYLVSRYGEWILLKPKARGLNLLVYILPFVVLGGGAILLRDRLKRWAGAGLAAPPPPEDDESSLSPENERWLEESLRRDG